MYNYLNSRKKELFEGNKVKYRGRVFWANMTTREIYAQSIDAEISGSTNGYKVARISDNNDIKEV